MEEIDIKKSKKKVSKINLNNGDQFLSEINKREKKLIVNKKKTKKLITSE